VTVVLDSSALLAIGFGEPGAERVRAAMAEAVISAVNASEIIARLIDRGVPGDEAVLSLREFEVPVRPFDQEQARDAGLLRAATRTLGLSLGDRACLALARAEGATVLTADRTWAGLDLGVTIEVIR
jgi:PIN domain nuclease of toxin-antitoxin system